MKSLREWRAERLWSVRDLAREAGVSTKTVSEIEHGRGVATFRTIRRITEALGLEPGEVTEFATALEERKKDAA